MAFNKIYIQVGYIHKWSENTIKKFLITEPESVHFDNTVPERKTVTVNEIRGTNKAILAVYETKEIKLSDRQVIRDHVCHKGKLLGKEIGYYTFTGNRFLEKIRKHKVDMLKQLNMKDDGTIFGEVREEITVPKKIIPAHKSTKYVRWDCWNDIFESDDGRER